MYQHLLLSVLSAVAGTTTARPQAPAPDIVVSADWLRTHINDPDVVVLDVGMPGMNAPDPYEAGHIPGAQLLDFHALYTGDGSHGTLTMQMLPVDSLRNLLEAVGVSDGATVVLYSTSRSISPVARTFMTLDYLGLGAHTRILDGGYDAWKAAGGSVETRPSAAKRGRLHVKPHPDVLADARYVAHQIADSGASIVDARAPEFYAGTARGHDAERVGHVPTARNVYFLTLADSVTSKYLTPKEARARFIAAGVRLNRPVIVYCHIGQTASVDYVQLRRLGIPVRLYDGSFEDWSRHKEYPVVMGATP